jgi:hypothetical protein
MGHFLVGISKMLARARKQHYVTMEMKNDKENFDVLGTRICIGCHPCSDDDSALTTSAGV